MPKSIRTPPENPGNSSIFPLTSGGKTDKILGHISQNARTRKSSPFAPAQRAAVWCEAEGSSGEYHLGAEGLNRSSKPIRTPPLPGRLEWPDRRPAKRVVPQRFAPLSLSGGKGAFLSGSPAGAGGGARLLGKAEHTGPSYCSNSCPAAEECRQGAAKPINIKDKQINGGI